KLFFPINERRFFAGRAPLKAAANIRPLINKASFSSPFFESIFIGAEFQLVATIFFTLQTKVSILSNEITLLSN
ncbi:hypothetical protein, partial [Mangrovimonas aestuarii]|uniref:hypothetical protein n=1 Tax=Mangrovimonas aestuarii TaxID=3018443 RepID=UPI0023787589